MQQAIALSESLIHIYDAAYSGQSWSEAMEACRLMTQADHTIFFTRGLHEDIKFSAQGGSPTLIPYMDQFAEYNRRFSGAKGYDDEGEAFLRRSAPCVAVLDTDIWSLDYLQARPELHFNMEVLNVFRKMYLNISQDPLVNSVALFYYNMKHQDIPQPDIQAVELLGPHLMKALDLSRWADGLRTRYKAVLSVIDKIEIGICVLDERGRVIVSNRHADAILSENDPLSKRPDGHLSSRDLDTANKVREIARQMALTSQGENTTSSIEIPLARLHDENPLLLIASPLRDAEMELERNLTGCLLTIIDTSRTNDLRVEAFAKAYGLTRTEARVAELMVTGLTTPEIAEELGVAPSTAQTHVKSIFQKVGCSSRVGFVWRAVQFSPPIV